MQKKKNSHQYYSSDYKLCLEPFCFLYFSSGSSLFVMSQRALLAISPLTGQWRHTEQVFVVSPETSKVQQGPTNLQFRQKGKTTPQDEWGHKQRAKCPGFWRSRAIPNMLLTGLEEQAVTCMVGHKRSQWKIYFLQLLLPFSSGNLAGSNKRGQRKMLWLTHPPFDN